MIAAEPAHQPVLRFAPSPNGALHLGHALSALVTQDWARRVGGRFLLRIEDIDAVRSRPEFIAAIYDDLAWLGIEWERPVRIQSEHLSNYQTAADRLEKLGLLYPCFATRSEILAATRPGAVDPDGTPLYPGLCKGLDPNEVARRKRTGEPFSMRLDMKQALRLLAAREGPAPLTFTELDADGQPQCITADPSRWGDVVIQRRDVPTSYHLSVVVDDALQGITHVTRGRDLFAATDVHRLLQVLLELPEPLYHHHRLVTDAQGRKLAKSARDMGLRELRQRGATPDEIGRMVGLG